MTTRDDSTSEIKKALDREVARRFDTRRLLARVERRAQRVTIAPVPEARRHRAGPLGALPVAMQWAGVGAAFLGAALGVRSLYLERTRVAPAVAEAHATPLSAPLVADAAHRTTEAPPPQPPLRRPVRVPAREAAPRASSVEPLERSPALAVPEQAEPAPPPASGLTEPVRALVVAPSAPSAPSAPPLAPRRTAPVGLARATGPGAPASVSGPATQLGQAQLVGGVHVKSFRFGGKDVWPEVREVREIGATLVMAPVGRRSARRASDTAIPAFELRTRSIPQFLLASAQRPGGTAGAYYARLFLGSLAEANPREQGLMSEAREALQIVPLREAEVWGDAEQERFLRRTFGLRSIVAVDGARIFPATDGEDPATSFVAGVGGQVFEVALRGMPSAEEGLHTIDLHVLRQTDRQAHPESRLDDLEATLVVQNGRIVILGLPSRGLGRTSSTIAFLALSPRFEQFAPAEDGERVLAVDGDVEPPVLVERAELEYPPQARELRVTGKVILQAVIRKDGTVDGVQVLRVPEVAGGEYLVEAAASSVRNWRYLPARLHGEPIDVYFTIVVEFTLREVP